MTSASTQDPHVSGPSPAAERYDAIRARTLALCDPLEVEDMVVQSCDDASPVKWHLAHTTWFFETFALGELPGYRRFHPAYDAVFNSYYDSVGPQFPKRRRGTLARPTVADILGYRDHVDTAMRRALDGLSPGERFEAVVETGLHHEQQHQELLLGDVLHLFSTNPLRPTYRAGPVPSRGDAPALRFVRFDGGIRELGADGHGFAFDNERPRHRRLVEEFEIASRAVTNGEFLGFVEDGGYERPELWTSEGWSAVNEQGWSSPLHWDVGERTVFTLGGPRDIDLAEPVVHVSWFEADAFARWAGARLPREDEWEVVAATVPVRGNLLEGGRLRPSPAEGAGGVEQLFGDVWEWTASAYLGYPGYRPAAGALGEYNGKFMCNQFVLRGGSFATPASHIRATYRNFYPARARWQFLGFRLAR
jgi:ergothioneine biosynthesis protein EgtB